MSNTSDNRELKKVLKRMRKVHSKHLRRLKRIKENGGDLVSYPGGQTIDDRIEREKDAKRKFRDAIKRLK